MVRRVQKLPLACYFFEPSNLIFCSMKPLVGGGFYAQWWR